MHFTPPASLMEFLTLFATAFCSDQSFHNFVTLVTGWILCPNKRTLSRILQAVSAYDRHHSVYYRFFTRARWSLDSLGKVLFLLIEPLCPGLRIYAPLDDTLCQKSGPHIFGIAMHYDTKRSQYGATGSKRRLNVLTLGHRFVVLSLYIPAPWNPQKGFALPILFRLYRSKKRCPQGRYKKPSQLARELVLILQSWLEDCGRFLVVTVDGEYACRNLIRDLPGCISVVGPIPKKAALNDFPFKNTGRGRPRTKGLRLPTPQQLIDDPLNPWKLLKVNLYGNSVEIEVKEVVCLWYWVCGQRAVRVVVTRDPAGRFADRCFFSTDIAQGSAWVLRSVAKRWSLEVTFRNSKQWLGLEQAQNGWWRAEHGKRRHRGLAGPTEHEGERGRKAVERTAPLSMLIYSLVIVWCVKNGSVRKDIKRAKIRAPWYGHKKEVSFLDMLWSIREEYWEQRILERGYSRQHLLKMIEELRVLASTA